MNTLLLALVLVCQTANPSATEEPALAGRFRVGLVTMKGTAWKLEDNFVRMEKFVRQAAADKAQVVVTPEGMLEGYVCADPYTTRERMLKVAQPVPDGPYVVRARKLAKELSIYLIFGFLELAGEDMYNSCVLISPQGRIIAKYSKVHPHGESNIRAGRRLAPFDTPLGRVGFLLCSDRGHSGHWPPLRAAGTQLIFLPMDGTPNMAHMQRRARETGSGIIIANAWSAMVIDATGKVLLHHRHKVDGKHRPAFEDVHVLDVDLTTATTAVKDLPALDDVKLQAKLQALVREAFTATYKRHWFDSEGRPTQFEIEERKKDRKQSREALEK